MKRFLVAFLLIPAAAWGQSTTDVTANSVLGSCVGGSSPTPAQPCSLASITEVGFANAVATTAITLSGVQTINGVAGTAGFTIILATAQGTGVDPTNGPWVMQTGAWTRPQWYATGASPFPGMTIQVADDSVTAGVTYSLNTTAAVTIGTTATTWGINPIQLNATTTATGNAANCVLASPNGSTGALSCRSLVTADYPPATPTIGTGASVPIVSTYNGTILNWGNGSSTWYGFLPTVNTLGVLPSGFQLLILNTGTGEGTICAVTNPSSATNCASTTSTIGGGTTYIIPPGSGVLIGTDAVVSPGNFEAVPQGSPAGGVVTLGASTTTSIVLQGNNQVVSAPGGLFTGNGFVPTYSGCGAAGARINAPAAGELGFCVSGGTQAGYFGTGGNLTLNYGASITGALAALTIAPTGSSPPTGAGLYLYGTGELGFGTNATPAGYIDTSQTLNWLGTISAGGKLIGSSLSPNGSTIPTGQGIYAPSSGVLGFGTNSVEAGYVDASQNLHWIGGSVNLVDPIVGSGSAPSISKTAGSGNCVVGTVTGNNLGGSFTLASGSGNCTFTIALPTVTHGYFGRGGDVTGTPAGFLQLGVSTTGLSISGSVNAATDTIVYLVELAN